MAISVKFLRTSSASTANTFVVTAGSGDSGKLQIQYNSSDIYNNLSGSTSDILSGASNTTITIPLTDGEIPKGDYYFNFVADVGSSDTATTDFQIDERAPSITPDADVYAPSFRTDDDSSYTVDNSTVSAATRSLTLTYPQTSAQPNLSAAASDTTTSLYISTSNVWTGAMQTTLSYDVTYTIAATTGYDTFTYQESGTGYNTTDIDPDNELSDLYGCINNLREQVNDAASKKRSNYANLLSKYTHVGALSVQFREGVIANNTTDLDDIIAQIKAITNCSGAASVTASQQSKKLYGFGGTEDSTQDIVASMFTDATQYGVDVTYDSSLGTISLENRGMFLNVYNDTGAAIGKGKAVYVSGHNSATGLPEVSLASNAASGTANAVGLIYADIASASSGRAMTYGWLEELDTTAYTIGETLYLSTAGGLLATDPAPDGYSQSLATVLEAAADGQLLVTPSRTINFNEEISGSSTVGVIQNNMVRVAVTLSAAGDIETLDSTGVELVASAAGRIIQIHSAVVTVSTAPSSGTQDVDFTIQTGTTTGGYNASKEIMHTGKVTSSVANSFGNNYFYPMIEMGADPITSGGAVGDGIYLTNSDIVGTYTDWTNAVITVTIFYSQHTPS